MCDCYNAKCEKCETKLPVHLRDYETDRNEIKVYCGDHIPKKNCRVYTLANTDQNSVRERFAERYEKYPVGWKMGIRFLTNNAKENADGNHPNLGCDWEEKDL